MQSPPPQVLPSVRKGMDQVNDSRPWTTMEHVSWRSVPSFAPSFENWPWTPQNRPPEVHSRAQGNVEIDVMIYAMWTLHVISEEQKHEPPRRAILIESVYSHKSSHRFAASKGSQPSIASHGKNKNLFERRRALNMSPTSSRYPKVPNCSITSGSKGRFFSFTFGVEKQHENIYIVIYIYIYIYVYIYAYLYAYMFPGSLEVPA